MELFTTPINSPIIIALTIIYFIAESISTFDTRIIQGKKRGLLPPDTPMLPEWTGVFALLVWGTWIFLFILNWAFAFILLVIKFVLKVLPILERIGGFIVSLFIGNQLPSFVAKAYSDSFHQQRVAARGLGLMSKAKKHRSAQELHHFLEKLRLDEGMPLILKLSTSINAIKEADISDQKKQELKQLVEKLYKE